MLKPTGISIEIKFLLLPDPTTRPRTSETYPSEDDVFGYEL